MKKRLEIKVGLFVAIGLVLVAVFMIQFSKGMSVFRPTYHILLTSEDAGGLREEAGVLMSGVQVGSVKEILLAADGKSVTIVLKIYSKFRVHQDARFVIEQSGFLGDQYVAIQPGKNEAPAFKDGGTAKTETPFNLQQAARSASALIHRLDVTAQQLGGAIEDIRRLLLNPETLTNVAGTIASLRTVSERALAAVDKVDSMVLSNSIPVSQSTSNLSKFSEQLNTAGSQLNTILSTNSSDIRLAVQNLERSAATLNELMADVKAGKGLAGAVLRDEKVATDVANLTANLSVTSSNLNRLGLWGIMWKRKVPKEEQAAPAQRLNAPKHKSG